MGKNGALPYSFKNCIRLPVVGCLGNFFSISTMNMENHMLPAYQSKGFDQFHQMILINPCKIHQHIYLYLFSFSSSQSCLRNSDEYCGFLGNLLVRVTIYYSRVLQFTYKYKGLQSHFRSVNYTAFIKRRNNIE